MLAIIGGAMKRLGPEPLIEPTATVERCRLGRFTEVGARTSLIESELGDYSYIVNDADAVYCRIGKFCSIAAHTRINPGDHPIGRVSQSHFTCRASAYFDGEVDEEAFFDWRRSRPVVIGHDVWICHGAIVLAGRTIGNGAVRAAGAIVSRDVPAYCVVAGVPAKVVKPRFCANCGAAHRRIGLVELGPHEAATGAARFPYAVARGLPGEARREKQSLALAANHCSRLTPSARGVDGLHLVGHACSRR
jgi:phosphonate metabolism protein (transferase hexapeptide repeat family)